MALISNEKDVRSKELRKLRSIHSGSRGNYLDLCYLAALVCHKNYGK